MAALGEEPESASALNLAGTIHRQCGRLDEALTFSKRAVNARPNSAFFHFCLGDCYRASGRLDEAIEAYHCSITLEESPQALAALGHAYAGIGRHGDAAAALNRAISLAPKRLPVYDTLARCLAKVGKWNEAVAVRRAAVAMDPSNARPHTLLAHLLLARGRCASSAESFRAALELEPRDVSSLVGLATALNWTGQWEQAAQAARRALIVDHRIPAAHAQLGTASYRMGELSTASVELQRALEAAPNDVTTLITLANVELERFRHSEAQSLLRRALDSSNRSPVVHSKLLLAMSYDASTDEAQLFAEHKRWAEKVVQENAQGQFRTPTADDPDRPLCIGYISPDLRVHAVSSFIEPIFAKHDSRQFRVVVFSDVVHPDETTKRLRSLTSCWHETFGISDDRVAQLITDERVDILVDLSGHTAFNRLPLFARRMAPLQLTYLGYPNTTGLPADIMNFRLTDATCDPVGVADALHTERLLRLERPFLCYNPPADAPAVADGPMRSSGAVTFGCFNHGAKLSSYTLDLWTRVLRRVNGSRLVLKNSSLGDSSLREELWRRFEGSGVSVELWPRTSSRRDHLACYGSVDVALDTYPYHGTTTTCEALWMGVPVVSLAGHSHRSRVGATILGAVGLSGLVATTADEYVELAAGLWERPAYLRELRAGLRTRMRESPLTDATGFVSHLETAYRRVWGEACRKGVLW